MIPNDIDNVLIRVEADNGEFVCSPNRVKTENVYMGQTNKISERIITIHVNGELYSANGNPITE